MSHTMVPTRSRSAPRERSECFYSSNTNQRTNASTQAWQSFQRRISAHHEFWSELVSNFSVDLPRSARMRCQWLITVSKFSGAIAPDRSYNAHGRSDGSRKCGYPGAEEPIVEVEAARGAAMVARAASRAGPAAVSSPITGSVFNVALGSATGGAVLLRGTESPPESRLSAAAIFRTIAE